MDGPQTGAARPPDRRETPPSRKERGKGGATPVADLIVKGSAHPPHGKSLAITVKVDARMTDRKVTWLENKLTLALWCSPGIALLIWDLVSTKGKAELLLNCYVLIATPFFLLKGSYPPLRSRWFWKAMMPICALIGVALYGYLQLANWLEYEHLTLPARMIFLLTGTIGVLEGRCAWRIVDATEPRINGEE